jgi:tetraacyldisaccharide 4'-kinase
MMIKNIQEKLTTIWSDDRCSDFSSPFCSFLYTLSLFYGTAVRLRNSVYDTGLLQTKKLPCPVVSVGNITVGGTGKTPMVIALANLLREKGHCPAVLSRGYAGQGKRSVAVVSDGQKILAGPEKAGDEPFLIALSANGTPVLTGRDRHAAGRYALDRLGVDTLVLDDAFQHRRVFRDLNLLLLDAERPFGNGDMLPRGSLREPRKAVGRADIIVLTRADAAMPSTFKADLHREFPAVPVFQARHRPVGLFRIRPSSPSGKNYGEGEAGLPLDSLRGKRVFAFAGIARPESFRKTIESLGGFVAAFKAYPDHHRYTKNDGEDILKAAREQTAEIILTTEKDGVKLAGISQAAQDIFMLRIEMEILSESKNFEDTILAGLSR